MEGPANADSKTLKWLKTAGTFLDDHKYWCSLAAIFSALICLLLYTASQGIPFPTSFVGSPELILIIMAVAYFVPFLFSFLLFMPFLLTTIASYILDYELFEEIYISKSTAFTKSNLLRFFLTVGLSLTMIPALIYMQMAFPDRNLPTWLYPILLIIFSATSGCLVFGCFAQKDRKDQKFKIWSTAIIYNIALFIWEMSILLIIVRLCVRYLSSLEWVFHPLYVASVLTLVLICFITTFPSTNNGSISRLDRVAMLSIIPTTLFLIVPVNVYSFGIALKTLKLGGGYEVYYYIDAKDRNYFPEDLFGPDSVAQKGLLRSPKIKIILRTQSESYIKIDTPKAERIFEIKNEKILYSEYFNARR